MANGRDGCVGVDLQMKPVLEAPPTCLGTNHKTDMPSIPEKLSVVSAQAASDSHGTVRDFLIVSEVNCTDGSLQQQSLACSSD